MSGDRLTILIFLVGLVMTGVAAGFQTAGWRSRVFYAVALIALIATIAYLRTDGKGNYEVALETAWAAVTPLTVFLCLLAVGGREPIKPKPQAPPEPPPPPPVLNPALTAEFLESLVTGNTKLEASRNLAPHANQLAKMRGQVKNIDHGWNDALDVEVAGLVKRGGYWWNDVVTLQFRPDQAEALAVIKPHDWIEFTGRVEAKGYYRWTLVDCVFDGRAEPPPPPKLTRRSATRKSAS